MHIYLHTCLLNGRFFPLEKPNKSLHLLNAKKSNVGLSRTDKVFMMMMRDCASTGFRVGGAAKRPGDQSEEEHDGRGAQETQRGLQPTGERQKTHTWSCSQIGWLISRPECHFPPPPCFPGKLFLKTRYFFINLTKHGLKQEK